MRYFLPKDTPGDLCLECHAEVTPPESRLHAPVALKECLECHGPHGSNREALLAREGNHVCVFCHIDFAERIENAVSVHEPVRGPCWDCHNPHAGTHAFFLSEDRPALCARCHSDIVGEGTPPLKYPHTVMTEGKACSACHDPHMAGFPRLLKRPSMDLCLGCHEGAVETADGRTLDEVGKRIEGSKFLHGPIRNKDCTPCHAAHGSDDPRLLTQAFPREFYAEYRGGMYALCWKCHDPDLVRAQETLATGFRNGRQNLHYVHVHLEKGRTCRACHHEHASNLPFHLRESVPFGEWELEIRFKQTSTGGMCLAGCHRPKAYDREKPVDNTPVGIPVGTPSSPRR